MKISESWLREWVNPDIKTDVLAEQLTMAGLEVDGVESAAPEFSKVLVAEVVDVKPHPDADKLRVCEVNVGDKDNLQIVCGASNVRKGLRIPAAVVGARLPGDFKIKKSKLRGEVSLGMLCGASELGLEESSDGLMELPNDAPVGENIRDYLNLDDQVIEIDLTPNRGDCLSIAGVAREVAVMNKIDVNALQFDTVAVASDKVLPIDIQAGEDCPRYLGRVIEGINVEAVTPEWMQERLNKAGLRTISPMVDVTNYVMLELGHPMHAFDLAKLDKGIVVRRASAGEKLTLLDDKEIELKDDALVIADHTHALALAGIMGGLDSSVTDSTTDIFLECAFFQPVSIAGKARGYGLHTDSSHRFERGVNPEQLDYAVERATQLIIDICGGKAGPVQESVSRANMPVNPVVRLRKEYLDRILGISLESAEVEDILTRLGMEVQPVDDGWDVKAPGARFDINIEADLIEEIARIFGYNNLPTGAYKGAMHLQAVPESEMELDRIQERLFDRGYQEVITYSFVDPDMQSLLDPDADAIALANPISSDMAVMRTSLWPGLIQALTYNLKRQQDRVRIFEYGLKFIKQDNEIKQDNFISGALCGSVEPEQWAGKSRAADYFDIKGDVESVLALTADKDAFKFKSAVHPSLHPGRSACIEKDGKTVGWVGCIHPKIQQKLGVKEDIYVFELAWDAISKLCLPSFEPLSKYPFIRRDLAIVVEKQVTSQQIIDTINGVLEEIIKDIRLFDVYEGAGVDSGRKSVALGLILQESSRTLTDQDVESATTKVVTELEKKLGATLRD